MTKKDIYRAWAPVGKKWVDWVRPVPFVALNNKISNFQQSSFALPFLDHIEKTKSSTAIIVDLPGSQSVEAGIVLAKNGYRPIPVYNGVMEQVGSRATTDNHSILNALVWGAKELENIEIQDNAPPAFLIDSGRLQSYKIDVSVFDNSWDIYHQDLPTEDYLLKNGISNIVIIGNFVAKDLKEIFAEYPRKQINIFLTNGYDEPKCVKKAKDKKN